MDWLRDPDLLWHTTKLGREEYMQRLLASLILGEAASGWNRPRPLSDLGADFIRTLHGLCFDATPDTPPVFVDEFELPARTDSERSGWPDHAAVWPERLFLIELKTERTSAHEPPGRSAAVLPGARPPSPSEQARRPSVHHPDDDGGPSRATAGSRPVRLAALGRGRLARAPGVEYDRYVGASRRPAPHLVGGTVRGSGPPAGPRFAAVHSGRSGLEVEQACISDDRTFATRGEVHG
jgi:hypothetical protein